MTYNQIQYQKLQNDIAGLQHKIDIENRTLDETIRHNETGEKETRRHNRKTETATIIDLTERNRHNLADEQLRGAELQETIRTHLANEGENYRSHRADETERNRHNLRDEEIRRESNRISGFNAGSQRMQAESSHLQAQSSLMHAEAAQSQAKTAAKNAVTNRLEHNTNSSYKQGMLEVENTKNALKRYENWLKSKSVDAEVLAKAAATAKDYAIAGKTNKETGWLDEEKTAQINTSYVNAAANAISAYAKLADASKPNNYYGY